ncbi:MAG: glutamate--tRNA ligase [Candidatus Woesearchaeota archaeon]
MEKIILKYALKNALDFGSVNSKVVLGQVLKDNPEFKKDVPNVLKKIEQVIKQVEKLSEEDIKSKLESDFPELLKEKKEKIVEGPLKPLPNAIKGKVVTRIAPSPSGALHIGHAYGAALNYEYAKMYNGKLILRIEDTNPENIYPQAYELIENDIRWLCEDKLDQVIIQSSRLGIYYDYAEKLVQMGKAYVCSCDSETWKELKVKSKACPCRDLNSKEQAIRYAKMFNEYAEGEVVLRLKTDIKDKNPAMRDFSIMRINEHVHPKTGKENRVWPLMVFSVAIDDHESGVTHVMNGKDHTDNAKKEAVIMHYLGWKEPQYLHWGRINFQGMRISSSETRQKIEQDEYHGWDDVRLPFLPALRKRGYQPEAFRKFALEIGLSLNDKTVAIDEFWKNINAFNKEIVEAKANRYFFVDNPIKIEIKNVEKREVEIYLHPDFPERGKRKFTSTNEFYIAQSDFQKLGEGYLHRLMDCLNFKLEGKKFIYHSDSYEEYKDSTEKGKIIHWVPVKNIVDVEVLLENGQIIKGFGEEALKKVKESDIIQFERRYFARIDQNKGKVKALFLHK